MKSHLIHIFLFLYESNLFRNWNQSKWIIQTKVMAFSCQLVILLIFLVTVCITHFYGVLTSYFYTRSLYSFKAKVLRVLFQLESPNSEQQLELRPKQLELLYDQPDAGIGLHMAPL